jgi:hypothetical protein
VFLHEFDIKILKYENLTRSGGLWLYMQFTNLTGTAFVHVAAMVTFARSPRSAAAGQSPRLGHDICVVLLYRNNEELCLPNVLLPSPAARDF